MWSGSLSPDALGCRDYIKHVNASRICNCGGLPCIHLQTAINHSGEPLTVASDGSGCFRQVAPYGKDNYSELIHFFHLFSIPPDNRGSYGLFLMDDNYFIILPISYHYIIITSIVPIDKKIEIWYSIFALKSSDFSIF